MKSFKENKNKQKNKTKKKQKNTDPLSHKLTLWSSLKEKTNRFINKRFDN